MTKEKLAQEVQAIEGKIAEDRQWLVGYINGHDSALSGMPFEVSKKIAANERLLAFLKEMYDAA